MLKRLLLALLLLPTITHAAGTCTYTILRPADLKSAARITQFTWTADTDGSVPVCSDGVIAEGRFGRLWGAETDPGTPAPTDNYTVAVKDARGLDLLGAACSANRDETNTEQCLALSPSGSEVPVNFYGPLTLYVSGNVVNGATGVVIVRWDAL